MDQARVFPSHFCCLRTQPSASRAHPGWLEGPGTFPVRALYFLECDWSPQEKEERGCLSILFIEVVVFILVGGTGAWSFLEGAEVIPEIITGSW